MLESLTLQNFRTYKNKTFNFGTNLNLIIGENAIGKTNILEAISLLSTGKSFKTSTYENVISFEESFGKIKGIILDEDENQKILEINLLQNPLSRISKRYFVDGVPRFLKNFIGNFTTVLFTPDHIEIITGSPSKRRDFLDEALILSQPKYYNLKSIYEKALKQRNALLEKVKKTGFRDQKLFDYWDNLLIENGNKITEFRSKFIEFLNTENKNIFDINVQYDKSEISQARLFKYKEAEIAAGNTLVGPQRDDLKIYGKLNYDYKELKQFGSRGQNRLSVLQLIALQFEYIKNNTQQIPTLLLDDIFSELDIKNTKLIIEKINAKQTIITSTPKEIELLDRTNFSSIIELN